MKIGRNEPCPCGSGNKYKKCCGLNQERSWPMPDELKTGTLLDDYFFLFKGIASYGQGLKQFGEDKATLNASYLDFKKRFRPGTGEEVSNGLFIGWFYLDLRFGKSQQTIGERFVEEGFADKLVAPGPMLVIHLVTSYCAFYEVKRVLDDWIIFLELGTGQEWRVFRMNEPFEREAKTGEVWYVRFVGDPKEAYIFMAPYIFPVPSKEEFTRVIAKQRDLYAQYARGSRLSERDIFINSCKASVPFWAKYFAGKDRGGLGGSVGPPEMVNTDKEPLRFSKIFFKVLQRERLEESLSRISNFDYDKANQTWIWFRKGYKTIKVFPRTILGTLSIHGEYVIAETNSLKRALRLKDKLMRQTGQSLSFERIEARDWGSMPPLAKEETEEFRRQQEKLHSDPNVQQLLREKADEYYSKQWIEEKEKAAPESSFRADVNGLRKRLGLI